MLKVEDWQFLSGKKNCRSWLEPAKSFSAFSDLYASVENILLTLNVDLGERKHGRRGISSNALAIEAWRKGIRYELVWWRINH